MSRCARAGRHTRIEKPAKRKRPPLMPLDYVLRVMRDETQPDAARDSMAIAAARFLYGRRAREDEPREKRDKPALSQRELADRVTRLLFPDPAAENKKARRRARRAKAKPRPAAIRVRKKKR